MDWISRIDLTLPDAAGRLGLTVARQHVRPCPSCGERGHGSAKTFQGRDGRTRWKCHRCGEGGDVVDLVAWVLASGPFRKLGEDDRCRVREWFAVPGALPPPRSRPWRPQVPADRSGAPSAAEIGGLWNALAPVSSDPEVAGFLERRGLPVAAVQGLDLARALHPGLRLPGWARTAGRSWVDGWRCISPTFEASGAIRSLRARWVLAGQPPANASKSVAPTGPGSATGSVLANATARALLEGREGDRVDALVTEGEVDFLTWATRPGMDSWAIFGLWQGAWTDEIADRIPDLSRVVVRTDPDDTGDDYARRVAESLERRCEVLRARPSEGGSHEGT